MEARPRTDGVMVCSFVSGNRLQCSQSRRLDKLLRSEPSAFVDGTGFSISRVCVLRSAATDADCPSRNLWGLSSPSNSQLYPVESHSRDISKEWGPGVPFFNLRYLLTCVVRVTLPPLSVFELLMQRLFSLIIFVWCHVLICSQTQPLCFFLLSPNSRSMVPLLQVISRGSPMSFEDSSRIIPLFYLFSSLFSHSLISIHDNEFFGDPIEGEHSEQSTCC